MKNLTMKHDSMFCRGQHRTVKLFQIWQIWCHHRMHISLHPITEMELTADTRFLDAPIRRMRRNECRVRRQCVSSYCHQFVYKCLQHSGTIRSPGVQITHPNRMHKTRAQFHFRHSILIGYRYPTPMQGLRSSLHAPIFHIYHTALCNHPALPRSTDKLHI